MRKTKRRRRGSGTAGIMIIVLAFLVVMTVQDTFKRCGICGKRKRITTAV